MADPRREAAKRALLERRLRGAGARAPHAAIPRRPDESPAALSFAQQRLWYLDQLEPNTSVYNISAAYRLKGALDRERLQRALTRVWERHESLRTSFALDRGTPVQRIALPPALAFRAVDPDAATRPSEAALAALLEREAEQPFDLARGPLARVLLVRSGAAEHALLLLAHHTVWDGASTEIFWREVSAAYAALAAGDAPDLPDLPIQYADYAVWQRRWFEAGELARQMAYWGPQLAGELPPLELPTDRPRPAEQTYRGAAELLTLSPALVTGVARLARTEGATVFMVLLAAYQILLARLSGQDEVLVGTPVANRQRPELEPLIGFFANTLVIRTRLDGSPTVREVVARVRDTCLAAFSHQDVPFERLVQEFSPARDLSRTPLFQALFTFQETTGRAGLRLPGLTCAPLSVARRIAHTDVALWVASGDGELRAALEYSTDLYERETIRRWLGHFQVLLEGAVAAPDTAVGRLPLLAAAERRRLLEAWNATAAPAPAETVHGLVAAQIRRTPSGVAVVCGDEAVTYEELGRRVDALALRLRAVGVDRGTLVGLCVERSVDMVVALLAVLETGGAYVPLDPDFPPDRLRFMVEDAELRVVVAPDGLRARVPAGGDVRVVGVEPPGWDGAGAPAAAPAGGTADDVAYVIYTSGSTGQPKGVMVPHGAVVNLLTSMSREPGLGPDDVLLAVTTLSFDIAALELLLPLVVGARVVIARREDAVDGGRLRILLERCRATVMQATPATWRLLLAAGWEGGAGFRVLCGGEAFPEDLAQQLAPRARAVWNVYGPTETTIWSTAYRVPRGGRPVLIGRPIANTEVYVVDPHGEPVPVGVPGELWIGGAGVARGYWRRPALTAERFVPHPLRDGAAVYRTGDWVRYRPDGNLEYIGRKDHQVKVRGFRIELGEIEAGLRKHAAVAEAVAVVRELSKTDARLVAYYTVADGHAEPTGTDLRAWLRDLLPEYMVPAAFVPLDALPLTPNGKIDRRALPEPELFRVQRGAAFEPPETETEVVLAEIWKELLGVDGVGRSDNFFDLGGHSLLSMRFIYQVEARLGAQLTARDVVLNTLDQLAARCDRAASENGHSKAPQRPGLLGRVAAAIRGNR